MDNSLMEKFNLIAKKRTPQGPPDYLIVGLGNIGAKYDDTRHNIGFYAVENIANRLGVKIDRAKFSALCGDGMLGEARIMLMRPTTFMNLSGRAVVDAMNFYKIPIENVIVIYDDVSLDVGRLRVRGKGSHGGHNGIRSIIEQTGSDAFPRVKIGVGQKPHKDYDLADWVLGKFSSEDKKTLAPILDEMEPLCKTLITEDLQAVMARFNR